MKKAAAAVALLILLPSCSFYDGKPMLYGSRPHAWHDTGGAMFAPAATALSDRRDAAKR